MTLCAVEGRPRVQRYEGMIAVWAGAADDPVGLAMYPAAALEVARDILALVSPDGSAATTSAVERLQILPPAAEGLTGRLRIITTDEQQIDLLLDWSNLVGLADAAKTALTAAPAAGQS